jgi:murein hydrolase activator
MPRRMDRFKSLQSALVQLCFVAALGLAASSALAAPSILAVQRELDKTLEQLAQEQSQQGVIKQQILQLEASQRTSKQELARLKQEGQKLEAEFQQLGKNLQKQILAFKPVEQAIEQVQTDAIKRLRAGYMFSNRSVGLASLLNTSSDAISVVRTSQYLQVLRRHDEKLVSDYSAKLRDRDAKQAEIDSARQRQEQLKAELEDREHQMEDQASWELGLLARLRGDLAKSDKDYRYLLGKRDKLHAYLKKNNPRQTALPQAASAAPREKLFKGSGLPKVARLPWPIEGVLVRKFGKYKSEDLDQELFSKGIELLTDGQVAVSAIHEGQIVFTGQMPGYGLVVIVDHGKRFYSVYGMLSSVFIAMGEQVKARQKLGVTGLASVGKSKLYFEVRENGAAHDPLKFLGQKF